MDYGSVSEWVFGMWFCLIQNSENSFPYSRMFMSKYSRTRCWTSICITVRLNTLTLVKEMTWYAYSVPLSAIVRLYSTASTWMILELQKFPSGWHSTPTSAFSRVCYQVAKNKLLANVWISVRSHTWVLYNFWQPIFDFGWLGVLWYLRTPIKSLVLYNWWTEYADSTNIYVLKTNRS